jgi:hypothetical protein
LVTGLDSSELRGKSLYESPSRGVKVEGGQGVGVGLANASSPDVSIPACKYKMIFLCFPRICHVLTYVDIKMISYYLCYNYAQGLVRVTIEPWEAQEIIHFYRSTPQQFSFLTSRGQELTKSIGRFEAEAQSVTQFE